MRSLLVPGLISLRRSTRNWLTLAIHRLGWRGNRWATARLRDGTSVLLRPHLLDWYVFNEAFMTRVYQPAFDFMASLPGDVTFLDLGANLGYTSLNAARVGNNILVKSFEPGPVHLEIFRKNMQFNPNLAQRIELMPYAVAGERCFMNWTFDPKQPGGSSLYKQDQSAGVQVEVRSFSDIVRECRTEAIIVKMDVEGSEYDILRKTPPEVWMKVRGIVIEPHEDPEGRMTCSELLGHLRGLGFQMVRIHSDLWWGVKSPCP